jgi:hypothetical protein
LVNEKVELRIKSKLVSHFGEGLIVSCVVKFSKRIWDFWNFGVLYPSGFVSLKFGEINFFVIAMDLQVKDSNRWFLQLNYVSAVPMCLN